MKQRYNVMLNPAIVKRLDVFAERNETSRSDVINQLLFDFLIDVVAPDPQEQELNGQLLFSEAKVK